MKVNRIECRNLTHFWENDPFWRPHSTHVSLAIIKSRILDGLCNLKDGCFQCFNLFYVGLDICDVLWRFKVKSSILLYKIFPGHWLDFLIYTIHIKDAEKVQKEAPNGVQGIHLLKNSFRGLKYFLSLTILPSNGLNGGLSFKVRYLLLMV